MTLLEVAEYLLRRAGEPLHTHEIIRRGVEQGLIEPTALDLPDIMSDLLARAVGDAGAASTVVPLDGWHYALRAWEGREAPSSAASEVSAADTEQVAAAPRSYPLPRVAVEVSETEPQLGSGGLAADGLSAVRARAVRVVGLARRTPGLPALRRMQGYLRGLLGWGLVNILGGLALMFRPRRTFGAGLARTLVAWGAAHTVLAVRAMEVMARDDQEVLHSDADDREIETRLARYRGISDLAITCGAVLSIAGAALSLFGRRGNVERGKGVGLLTQGSFLFSLGAVDAWLRSRGATSEVQSADSDEEIVLP